MTGFGAVFEALYTRLVLRDLFGKIAPGALFLLSARVTLAPSSSGATIGPSLATVLAEVNAADLGAWIVFGALAWLVGLAMQGVGEIIAYVPYLPVRYYPVGKSEEDWRSALVKFDASGVATPDDKQRFERLVVVKEASGNGFVAAVTALGLWLCLHGIPKSGTTVAAVMLTVAAAVGLARLHYTSGRGSFDHLNAVGKRQPSDVGAGGPPNDELQRTRPAQATEPRR